MGFDEQRAGLAVKKGGGCMFSFAEDICGTHSQLLNPPVVHGAIQWLEDNQDKPLDEIEGPVTTTTAEDDDPNALPPSLLAGEVAKSLVCNECGKRFRSHAQAEFHATKT